MIYIHTGTNNLANFTDQFSILQQSLENPATDNDFDFQELEITADGVHIGWSVEEEYSCPLPYVVQKGQANLSAETVDITNENVIDSNSTDAILPADQTSEPGASFRIIARFENGTICSSNSSRRDFYRFDGM